MPKTYLSESDICDKFIRPAMVQAGWSGMDQIFREYPLREGRVVVRGNKAQRDKSTVLRADYALFYKANIPLAVVEAKRKNVDVSGALQQAKRYSRTFTASSETDLHDHNWGAQSEYRIPFVFSANGRPYLRQLATKSGIWFCDLRHPENRSQALDGWEAIQEIPVLRHYARGLGLLEHDLGNQDLVRIIGFPPRKFALMLAVVLPD